MLRGVNPNDVVAVQLTDQERYVLGSGLVEWGGPARCTEELAIAMGFRSVADLFTESDRLIRLLEEGGPMSAFDWARMHLATEIVFASDVVGSGADWVHTVGISDAIRCGYTRPSWMSGCPHTKSPSDRQ